MSVAAATNVTSGALIALLGDVAAYQSNDDSDLDTTLPNVMLDQDDIVMLDVGFSDDAGNYTVFSGSFLIFRPTVH